MANRELGEDLRCVRDDEPAGFGRMHVDVVVPDAEVREDPGAQRLHGQLLRGDPVRHRGKERVGAAQGFLQLGRSERVVVAVQAGCELPLQPVLDRPGELACHHDERLLAADHEVEPRRTTMLLPRGA